MIEVRLSANDMARAELIGELRMESAQGKDRQLAYGSARERYPDVIGAGGELAVAIALGRAEEWSPTIGALDTDEGDVFGWDAKATKWENGHLLLHPDPKDPRHHPFALVVGTAPWLRIAGWCYGHEGKQERYWREPQEGRPCYMVPQEDLREFTGYTIEPI